MGTLWQWQDLRYGLRMMRKSPAFTLTAVLTLALGIGATTAMFSVLYQALLAPLPYAHPDRLLHVNWISPSRGTSVEDLNARQVQYVEQNSHSFSSTATMFFAPGCNLVSGSNVQYVDQAAVSPGFFRTFSAEPILGRTFVAADALAKPAQVAVISYGLWKGRLGGDPGIVGQTIKCNDFAYTVIGVLPRTFTFPEESADVWIPDRIENYLQDSGSNYWMVGRLRDGVTRAQAQEELSTLSARFHPLFPTYAWEDWIGKDGRLNLVPLQEWRMGDRRQSLLLLFGAVSLVLLIAAANVAGLVLTRATGRARELATRLALGATRARLVRQMLAEAVLLSLFGGVAALVIATWSVDLLSPVVPPEVRQAGSPLNLAMLLFALAVSLAAGLLAGILPALQATRGDLYAALKQGEHGSGGGRQHRLRKLLVTSEVALALLLLVGSALLVRSFIRLRGVAPGVDPRGVLVAELSLGSDRYQKSAAVAQFQRDVLARVRALPGVAAAATVSAIPGRRDLNTAVVGGDCAGAQGAIQYRAISPSYFATVGIPLRRGRAFAENETPPVAMINEAFARNRCWQGKDPVGRQVWMGKSRGDAPRQIVGIVGDTHDYGPARPATPTVFVPQWQVPDGIVHYTNTVFLWSVVVRGNTDGLAPAVERAIREVDPEQPAVTVVPLAAILGNWLKDARAILQLMGAFAGLALLLTAIGLYGVLSFYVTQRTREIGIRMALGATRRRVLGLVIGEGLLLVGLGAGIGVMAAVAATRLLAGLLFGTRATDPPTFIVATVFLFLVAGIASYVPARRATRVDPMVALRYE